MDESEYTVRIYLAQLYPPQPLVLTEWAQRQHGGGLVCTWRTYV